MIYNFNEIEKQARKKWNYDDNEKSAYKVENDFSRPKYYVLDMFPYPSGAGLHVGHPLGYIFSDIISRYKRMQGFNVLHPMGFDAFGLPAEQYAIQTGQHPEITTKQNLETYRNQLRKIGFCYDWSREVSTCEPEYYKWTQWIFLKLYNSIYCYKNQSAYNIAVLIKHFEEQGNHNNTAYTNVDVPAFSAEEWKKFSDLEKQNILMDYRLAYQKESFVNWCPALGTVLANDEIVNGVSERGGHPVEKKKMSQWFLRITAYAERLLAGLDRLDWTDAMKEMQRNWIGKSKGAMVSFPLKNHNNKIEVFTTRVDTIFGVSFLVIAPEHELVQQITTDAYKTEVENYIKKAGAKSDIERQAEVKETSGQFTGAYVLHPFTQQEIPVYIADYVLAGYGTGAVMAVPSGDQRDWLFAKKYDLPIIPILDAQQNIEAEADATKEGKYINSDFINGLNYTEATDALIKRLENEHLGYGKIQYKMRDAGYSRQRYWGEPFPIYYDENGIIHTVPEDKLPITLPQVESYKPTGTGESPLATATDWVHQFGANTRMETDTMPGYAGSSWYFLRYMNPKNENNLVDFEVQDYWQNVDLYVGGSEHAVGHLLYSRFWHKFLKDIGKVSTEEPFKKMVNQGMIQGVSRFVYRLETGLFSSATSKEQEKNYDYYNTNLLPKIYASKKILEEFEINNYSYNSKYYHIIENIFKKISNNIPNFIGDIICYGHNKIHIDIKYVNPITGVLDIERLKKEDINYKDAIFITEEDGNYYCGSEVEKMSKSKFNVVNPDEMIAQHGADVFRMFEMFLGPIDTAKPWDTNGISGVSNFLRKFWRLFFDDMGNPKFSNNEPSAEELKIIHKCIKKINQDIEHLSLNTCISTFMICVNDLGKIKSVSKAVLLELTKLIAPFAPHTAEVLWEKLGQNGFVIDATYPTHDEQYLVESNFTYPIQINGKHRTNIEISLDASQEEVEQLVLADEQVQKFLEGKTPKKFILVKGRIVNIVI
jgi:leucyl-tRNA synthetase